MKRFRNGATQIRVPHSYHCNCASHCWAIRFTGRSRRLGAAEVSSAQKSIAVLPFENLSEDKANAYFAEGIQDEILTRLAKIADLKVISRTSTQRFKSAPRTCARSRSSSASRTFSKAASRKRANRCGSTCS